MGKLTTAPAACRNCDAPVSGDYCAHCGQETRIELPTFRSFMREAAGRYVALDGRLWRTLYALIARPGFLTLEYFAGRRRRYIRPARLFLVTSILLFAIIGLVKAPAFIGDEVVFADAGDTRTSVAARGASPAPAAANRAPASSAEPTPQGVTEPESDSVFGIDEDFTLTLKLRGQDLLPEPLKARRARFKLLSPEQKAEQLYAGVLRFGPYAMVALLPAFAFLLQLAYLGRGKRYPGRPRRYAEHLVYSAHLHAFVALVLVLIVSIPSAPIRMLLGLWIVIYVLRSGRLIYRGRRWAGLLRAVVVAIAYSILISLAMGGLLVAAILWR